MARSSRDTFAGRSRGRVADVSAPASIETTQGYARLTDEVVMREAERISNALS